MRGDSAAQRLIAQRDLDISLRLNRMGEHDLIRDSLVLVSKLGDGPIWYAVILGLPLVLGVEALGVSVSLALSTLSGVAVYSAIKRHYRRPRPYRANSDFLARAVALDEYSFPSGHTLHAAGFSLILLNTMPTLGLIFLPFALATAISRVVLGMHYLSDVLAGALVGLAVAGFWLSAGSVLGLVAV